MVSEGRMKQKQSKQSEVAGKVGSDQAAQAGEVRAVGVWFSA
jgi:hypothetical protein